MSPEASTARPDNAITFFPISLATPAMPIADKRPPIVVGIRHTRSAVRESTVILIISFDECAKYKTKG